MKKLILLFLLLTTNLFAAVTKDSTIAANHAQGTSPTLSSVVVGNHSDRLLIVAVGTRAGFLYENVSCTFNTTETMTWFGSYTTSNDLITLWYLRNPSITTASVACSLNNSDVGVIGAFSLYGVDQTIPFRSIKQNAGSAATSTGNLVLDTVSGDYCLSILMAGNNISNVTNLVPGNSATEEYDVACQAATSVRVGGAFLVASGATTTMSSTWTNSETWAFMAIAVKPSPTPSTQIQRDSLKTSYFAAATSYTLSSVAVAANSNRLLVVTVANRINSATNITGCTFNGVALTKLTAVGYASSNLGNQGIWYIKDTNIAAGAVTANVVCSSTATVTAEIAALSLYNVNQTTTFRDTQTSAPATNTTGTVTLTTVAGDYCVAALMCGTNAANVQRLRPAPDFVEEWELGFTAEALGVRANVSVYNAAGTSTPVTYSWQVSAVFALTATAIQPYVATPVAPLMYYRKLIDN